MARAFTIHITYEPDNRRPLDVGHAQQGTFTSLRSVFRPQEGPDDARLAEEIDSLLTELRVMLLDCVRMA